jgi:signal transduction histidine kinase
MRITSDQFAEYDDLEHLTAALRCQEFAAAPLISRGRTEGLIIADNSITGEDISDEDVNRLSIITNQAGVAIENSQLLNSLEEKVEALRQAYLDLKKNRDLRLRAERLSVVGEVAASVAHEIRNPLTSIGGFTRAVLRDLENIEKTRTNRRFLTIILEEVKRLERIVNEILEFVRPVMPRYENANLNEVIEETFNMMAGEIDESRIVISKDYQDDLSLVWMDPDQIRQVLLNLLQNAIHAIEETGMLSVITEGDTRNVRVHISDTGHGIPAENREKLFTAFFTTKSTGSGLGLTVSNQIIKNHGGSIEVESSRGEGSTFVITLPVQSQEETNEEENLGRRRRTEPADSL